MIAITESSDPRIEAYRAVRDRDLLSGGERFIAEGEVVLRVLLRAPRFGIESILLSEKRAPALGDLLSTVPESVPVYVAAQEVMNGIVGFAIHRGVLAVGLRPQPPAPGELLGGLGAQAIVLGAIGIANHDNVGGIFRNAAAFGARAVLLDGTSCDPLYR